MEVELVPPGVLKTDKKIVAQLGSNPARDAIAESIAAEGRVIVPLLADRHYLVLDGHTRLEIAREKGIALVPVIRLELAAHGSWRHAIALAMNLHRRHILPQRRIALVTSLARLEKAAALERKREGGRRGGELAGRGREKALAHSAPVPIEAKKFDRANDRLAAQAQVSRNTYEAGVAVLERSPALAERMLKGDLSIKGAQLQLRREELTAELLAEEKAARREKRASGPVYRGSDPSLLETGKYRTVYADFPWPYDDRSCEGAPPYPTMELDEIRAFPIPRIAQENAHLWLWITWPKLRDGVHVELFKAWDFEWRKGEVIWDKQRATTGRAFRSRTEVLLFAHRGNLPLLTDYIDPFISAPRGKRHSEKPALARELVERVSPGPRIELFGRQVPRTFGDVYGLEAEHVVAGLELATARGGRA